MFLVVGDTADYVVSWGHYYCMIILIIIMVILKFTHSSDSVVNVVYDYSYLCASKL